LRGDQSPFPPSIPPPATAHRFPSLSPVFARHGTMVPVYRYPGASWLHGLVGREAGFETRRLLFHDTLTEHHLLTR